MKPSIPENPFVGIEGQKKVLHCILEASEKPVPDKYGNIFVYNDPANPHKSTLLETGKRITVRTLKRGKFLVACFL